MILMHQYLPDLPAQMTSKQLWTIIYIIMVVTGGMPEMVFEYI